MNRPKDPDIRTWWAAALAAGRRPKLVAALRAGRRSRLVVAACAVAQVPGGLGAGPFYWAPDWIPGVGWEPGANIGSPNVNLTLFNFEGAALPSIGIFQNPAGVCERHAPDSSPCIVG
jgi:hypothetical protein